MVIFVVVVSLFSWSLGAKLNQKNGFLCPFKFTCKCKNVAQKRMQRGVVARICEVFVADWCNLIFHIHDHTDSRCLFVSQRSSRTVLDVKPSLLLERNFVVSNRSGLVVWGNEVNMHQLFSKVSINFLKCNISPKVIGSKSNHVWTWSR